MNCFKTTGNQWAIGFGLRRSTIQDANRWLLWCNYGYTSAGWSWSRNPHLPIIRPSGEGA